MQERAAGCRRWSRVQECAEGYMRVRKGAGGCRRVTDGAGGYRSVQKYEGGYRRVVEVCRSGVIELYKYHTQNRRAEKVGPTCDRGLIEQGPVRRVKMPETHWPIYASLNRPRRRSRGSVYCPNSKYQLAAPNVDTREPDLPLHAYKGTVASARHASLHHRNTAAAKHRCKIPKMVPVVGVAYW